MIMQDMHRLHSKVLGILDNSDRIFLEGLGNPLTISQKLDVSTWADIVTAYDRKIENMLVERLSAAFSDIGFITEEKSDRELKEWNWIIDPIDGTFNYAHGVQIGGISIALWQENEPQYGIC